jgi:hypothetical protein
MKKIVLSNVSDELYWKLKIFSSAERKNVTAFVVEIVERQLIAYEKKHGKTIVLSVPQPPKLPMRLAKKIKGKI